MGASGPKSMDGGREEGISPHQSLLDQMEEKITDAILSGSTDDFFLGLILEITIPLVRQKRPLFQNPLDEPVLYKHFIQVLGEALDDLVKVETGMDEAKKITGK